MSNKIKNLQLMRSKQVIQKINYTSELKLLWQGKHSAEKSERDEMI
jgi:hypothetical protein